MSGLLNLALPTLQKLMKIDLKFNEQESTQKELDRYKLENDNAFAFLKDCCTEEAGARTGKQEIFNGYRKWCEENGFKPISQRKFNATLQQTFLTANEYRFGAMRQWNNVKLT